MKIQESFISSGFSDSNSAKHRSEKIPNEKVRMSLWDFLHLRPDSKILSDQEEFIFQNKTGRQHI